MSKSHKKLILITLSIIILIIGISAGVYLVLSSDSFDTRKEASGTIEDYTSLMADKTVNGYARMNGINVGTYDPISNKTFVVYSGGIKNSLSACSPFIVEFDHKTKLWSQSVEITKSSVQPDSHNYPQVLIDDLGYIHVFHSSHTNHEIIHAKSKSPRSITAGWSLKTIQNTKNATYVAAFRAKDGGFYLFYRSTEGNGDVNPPLTNWYEPQYYAKSKNLGETWSTHLLIDPEQRPDIWNTIYVKRYQYDEKREGVHMVYGLHKEHNDYLDKHYYMFFSFQDDKVYSAKGKMIGNNIDRFIFDENCNSCKIFEYGKPFPATKFGNIRIAMDLDGNGYPIIAYNRFGGDSPSDYNLEISRWQPGTGWLTKKISYMNEIKPHVIEYKNDNNIDIYAVHKNKSVVKLTYNGSQWEYIKSYYRTSGDYISHIDQIADANPEIAMIFVDAVKYSDWNRPKPVGKMYSLGKHSVGASRLAGYVSTNQSSCTGITGWASDFSFSMNVKDVHVYDNGKYLGSVMANKKWDDTVGLHGFVLNRRLMSDKHTIHVIAEHPNGIDRFDLNNSPLELDCINSTRIKGYIDPKNTTCKLVRGWASDRNFNLTVNRVEVFDNGRRIRTTAANKYYNPKVGNHGFYFNYNFGSGIHKIQAYGVDTRMDKKIELGNSPWEFSCD